MIRKFVFCLAAAVFAIGANQALAHHSYQMFDTSKEVTYVGTLKAVEWTNPHMWLQVVVEEKGKAPVEYGFEGGSPTVYGRMGWRKANIPLGDKVTVVGNPLRNGQPGANLVKITFSNGAVLAARGTRPDGSPAAAPRAPGAAEAP